MVAFEEGLFGNRAWTMTINGVPSLAITLMGVQPFVQPRTEMTQSPSATKVA